jgi:hypothetical protein
MCQNTAIIIRKDRVNGGNPIEINKGVQRGCPSSRIMFKIYIDKVTKDWLKVIKQNILVKHLSVNGARGSVVG